jgi:fructose-1,6-bisphosphatase/inositol monophosphatase family enzyme
MDWDWLLNQIRRIHEEIRYRVTEACESGSQDAICTVIEDGEGDTIYAVDRISEDILVEAFDREIAARYPLVLIAEGLHGGKITLPRGTKESKTVLRVIADPIDGTRCRMYQKRSGWILTGVALNRGEETSLSDIEIAIQTELPLVKQHLCDTLWAFKGAGVQCERLNRVTGERHPILLKPSTAVDLANGFGSVTRFFAGAREISASIDDEIAYKAQGPTSAGKSHCFEGQYLSTGGQLYELMSGHDRFIVDLRPLLHPADQPIGLCCHPYDICTELIAREAGVLVADEIGNPLRAPLNLEAEVAWSGYANARLRDLVEPLLHQALQTRGLLIRERLPGNVD